MHAYIISSKRNVSGIEEKISEILKKEGSLGLEFTINSVKDVEELQKNVKMLSTQKRTFIIRNVEKSSLYALNSMLKILEEPSKNTSFILTTNNLKGVIPTIRSRCQIINIQENVNLEKKRKIEIEKFLKMKIGEALLYVNKISKRENAVEFLESLITFIESKIEREKDKKNAAKILSLAVQTLSNIKSKGNIKLQLTRMIINIYDDSS